MLALAAGAVLTGCHEHGHRIRYRGHHEEIAHYRRAPVVVHEVIPRRRPHRPAPPSARHRGGPPPTRRPGRRGRN